MKTIVSGILFVLLLIGVFTGVFNVQLAKANASARATVTLTGSGNVNVTKQTITFSLNKVSIGTNNTVATPLGTCTLKYNCSAAVGTILNFNQHIRGIRRRLAK